MRRWVAFVVVAACGDNDAPVFDASTKGHDLAALPAKPNHELDLLFVLANDPDDQTSLGAAVPDLIAALSLDGSPDLHLATITSDLGTSTVNGIGPSIGNGPSQCAGTGDDGALFMNRFTTDPSELPYLLSVGPNGCAFVQPLAAMRAAFANPANVGFRRAEAALGVIVLADQDDCSALDPSLFDPNAAPTSRGSAMHAPVPPTNDETAARGVLRRRFPGRTGEARGASGPQRAPWRPRQPSPSAGSRCRSRGSHHSCRQYRRRRPSRR